MDTSASSGGSETPFLVWPPMDLSDGFGALIALALSLVLVLLLALVPAALAELLKAVYRRRRHD